MSSCKTENKENNLWCYSSRWSVYSTWKWNANIWIFLFMCFPISCNLFIPLIIFWCSLSLQNSLVDGLLVFCHRSLVSISKSMPNWNLKFFFFLFFYNRMPKPKYESFQTGLSPFEFITHTSLKQSPHSLISSRFSDVPKLVRPICWVYY